MRFVSWFVVRGDHDERALKKALVIHEHGATAGGGGGGVVVTPSIVTTDGLDLVDRESYGHVAVLRPKTTTKKEGLNGRDEVEEEEEESSGLVGAIGCVTQVLVSEMPLLDLDSAFTKNTDTNDGEEPGMERDNEEGGNGDGASEEEEEENNRWKR